MELRGNLGIYCESCGSREGLHFDAALYNVTEFKALARKMVRAKGWKVTKEDKAYCPECAARMGIRKGRGFKHLSLHEYDEWSE